MISLDSATTLSIQKKRLTGETPSTRQQKEGKPARKDPIQAQPEVAAKVEKQASDSTAVGPEQDMIITPANSSRSESRLLVDLIVNGGLISNKSAHTDTLQQIVGSTRQWGAAQLSGGGVRLNYQLSNQYLLGSGLLVESMQWKDTYTGLHITYDSTYQYLPDSTGTGIDSVLHVQQQSFSFSVQQANTATYVGAPFAITYRQNSRRIGYYFTLGAQINILVNGRRKILMTDSTSIPISQLEENRFRRFVPLLIGNIGVSYRFSKHISFLIETRFLYTVSSVYKKPYGPNPHIFVIGVNSGIRLSF